MNTLAIIAAAGNAKRWSAEPLPKQLLTIRGEVLIERIVRQVSERFPNWLLMANDKRYGPITVPESTSILPGTALGQTAQYWDEYPCDSIVILSDVYFTDHAADMWIDLTKLKETSFLGRLGDDRTTNHGSEIFTMWLHKARQEILKASIKKVRESGLKTPPVWNVYKDLFGFNFRLVNTEEYGANFLQPLDETDDFDTPEEFVTWCQRYG